MMDWTGLREGQETGGKLPTTPPTHTHTPERDQQETRQCPEIVARPQSLWVYATQDTGVLALVSVHAGDL